MISNEKWDRRFLEVAKLVGSWSKDPKRKVGCVVVNQDRRILSTGYNGLPRQLDSISVVSNELKNSLTIHAEVNALANIPASLDIASSDLLTVYITYPPCEHCAKILTENLILARVVWYKSPTNNTNSKWLNSMSAAIDHLRTKGVVVDAYVE